MLQVRVVGWEHCAINVGINSESTISNKKIKLELVDNNLKGE